MSRSFLQLLRVATLNEPRLGNWTSNKIISACDVHELKIGHEPCNMQTSSQPTNHWTLYNVWFSRFIYMEFNSVYGLKPCAN